ncbi:MAG: serine--tRNA ligase, partial [Nitrososphaera sp.]|nr:serine--tRNA ligase [Nitrososphaera sp.]
MIDPRMLKENPRLVEDMLRKRNIVDFPLDQLINYDKRRRELIIETQELRQKKNAVSETIAGKKKRNQNVDPELGEMKQVSSRLGQAEQEMASIENEFKLLLASLPNLLHESVPIGRDEKDNAIVRSYGIPRVFDFKARDHVDLASSLDLADIERASKISGARFYFLKNELVMMNQALVLFALVLLSTLGYTPLQ